MRAHYMDIIIKNDFNFYFNTITVKLFLFYSTKLVLKTIYVPFNSKIVFLKFSQLIQ